MGPDGNFRDLFSRVVHGARISLSGRVRHRRLRDHRRLGIGAVAGFAAAVRQPAHARHGHPAGIPGAAAGHRHRHGPRARAINAQLAIGIVAIPSMRASCARRAHDPGKRLRDRVTALGECSRGLLFRRILPNALTPVVVAGTLGIGGAILEVAALSFLGLGAQPPTAEWGSMIGIERNPLFAAPHLIFFPGIAIVLTVSRSTSSATASAMRSTRG